MNIIKTVKSFLSQMHLKRIFYLTPLFFCAEDEIVSKIRKVPNQVLAFYVYLATVEIRDILLPCPQRELLKKRKL